LRSNPNGARARDRTAEAASSPASSTTEADDAQSLRQPSSSGRAGAGARGRTRVLRGALGPLKDSTVELALGLRSSARIRKKMGRGVSSSPHRAASSPHRAGRADACDTQIASIVRSQRVRRETRFIAAASVRISDN
jgi:hypothetical protein